MWESGETTKDGLLAPPTTNKLTKINIYPVPNPKRNGSCRKPSRRLHKFPYQNEGEQSEQNYDLIKCNILPFFLAFYAITKTKIWRAMFFYHFTYGIPWQNFFSRLATEFTIFIQGWHVFAQMTRESFFSVAFSLWTKKIIEQMKTFVDKLSSLEGNRYGGAIEGLSRQVFMGTEENIVTGCVNLVSCKLNVNLKVLLSGMYEFIIPPAVGVFC